MIRLQNTWRLGLLLMLVLPVLNGCGQVTVSPRHRVTMSPGHQITIREGTLLRLEDGWEVGLQLVYWGQYADAAGQVRDGWLARISVWDGQAAQAEILEVHEGSTFIAGDRYQVVTIAARRASGLPGTAGASITLARLP